MDVPSFVPEGLARTTIDLRGAAGAEWLERLPATVALCEERWSLAVGLPFPELSYNYAARAIRADGTAAVLKLSFPNAELRAEAEALRLFDGRGAVRLLEVDLDAGAMLLERLGPGLPLTSVRGEEEATSIAADVLGELWRPVPPDHPFPTVADWALGLARLRRDFGGGTGPLPTPLVERAEALFAELLKSQTEPVLLHGDLHHYNVLAAGRRPWLAIDPKGVVGEPAYDTGALLRNPAHLLRTPQPAKVLERRLDQLCERLDLDRSRVAGWSTSQAVLAAYWSLEESGRVWDEALAFAELLAGIEA
jgi:streptomycin 6-kinase